MFPETIIILHLIQKSYNLRPYPPSKHQESAEKCKRPLRVPTGIRERRHDKTARMEI